MQCGQDSDSTWTAAICRARNPLVDRCPFHLAVVVICHPSSTHLQPFWVPSNYNVTTIWSSGRHLATRPWCVAVRYSCMTCRRPPISLQAPACVRGGATSLYSQFMPNGPGYMHGTLDDVTPKSARSMPSPKDSTYQAVHVSSTYSN